MAWANADMGNSEWRKLMVRGKYVGDRKILSNCLVNIVVFNINSKLLLGIGVVLHNKKIIL